MPDAADIRPPHLVLAAVPLVTGALLVAAVAGVVAGVLAAIVAAAAVGLARHPIGRRALAIAGALIPAAIVLGLGLSDGGYDVDTLGATGCAGALLGAVLVALRGRPTAATDRLTLAAVGCLLVLAGWGLASLVWSDAPGRALVEAARTSSYAVLVLVGAGLVAAGVRREWAFAGVTAALWVVTAVALEARLLPEGGAITERIASPIGYTNGLGVVAAVTTALLLHWTSAAESRLGRVLPVMAVVVPVATLSLTFSRGALIVLAVALVVYPLVTRRWHVLPGFVIGCVTAAAAWLLVYDAPQVANATVAGEPYLDASHALLTSLAIAGLAGSIVRALAFPVDGRLRRRTARTPRGLRLGAIALFVLAVVGAGAAAASTLEVSSRVERRDAENADVRQRLTQATTTGRGEIWTALRQGFEERPLLGTGAGTSALLFDRYRTTPREVSEGHSLYGEALAELGPLGLLTAAGGVLLLLLAAARRARAAPAAAGLCAAGAVWAVHAAIDWDWELAGVSAWFFVGAGLATARPVAAVARSRGLAGRAVAVVVLTALAAGLALVAANDRHVGEVRDAFDRGDCAQARVEARRAMRLIDARPEVHHALAYCAARERDWRGARREIQRTRELDPRNARYAVSQALIAAASGRDPEPAARAALRLRPIDEETRWLIGEAADDPRQRRRFAERRLSTARDIR